MSKTNTMENSMLLLFFNNTDFANIGDAGGLRGSVGAGSLYVSLHTASPGEAGDQTTNEISYTGYARVAVARSGAGWTVSANNVSNTSAITFGACTAGSGTATYVGIGTASAAAGILLYYCLVTTPGAGLAISAGITPQIDAGTLDVNED